jgi:hypothetical protein
MYYRDTRVLEKERVRTGKVRISLASRKPKLSSKPKTSSSASSSSPPWWLPSMHDIDEKGDDDDTKDDNASDDSDDSDDEEARAFEREQHRLHGDPSSDIAGRILFLMIVYLVSSTHRSLDHYYLV